MSNETTMERLAQEKALSLGIELLPLKDSFAEMRKRMIDGWAMCQLTCPITGFPLVKKGDVLWSIRCKCPISDPSNSMGGIQAKSVKTATTKTTATPQKSTKKNVSTSGKKKHFMGTPGRRERMNVQSKRISEKLLMGWKMLKAVCPITNECPLLEDKNGRQWSAALNMYVDEYKEVDDVPNDETPPLQNSISQPSKSLPATFMKTHSNVVVDEPSPEHDFSDEWKPPTAEEEREMAEKQKRHDEMSKRMGQMLLTGWKMLDEICPVTGEVPLMQHKDGRKFSVALNACIEEEKHKEGGEEAVEEAVEEAPVVSAPTTKSSRHTAWETKYSDNAEANMNKDDSNKTFSANNNESDYDEEFVKLSSNVSPVDTALRAVNNKLVKLSENLERSTNGSDTKLTLENIINCCNAIKGLKEIQNA
jgi:uncharacterized Zn finger protein (UPF0148 family)